MKALILMSALTLLLSGCLFAPQGSGNMTGASLEIDNCAGKNSRTFAPYNLHLGFMVISEFENYGELRFQFDGAPPQTSDFIQIQISDAEKILTMVGQAIPIGATFLRGNLHLFRTCPNSFQAIELSGSITFESIGFDKGDRVKGTFTVDAVDSRTQLAIGSDLKGTFNFIVKVGRPYKFF